MGAPALEQFETAPTYSDFKYLLKTHLFTVVYAGEYVGIGVGAVVVMYCLSVCFWYLLKLCTALCPTAIVFNKAITL